MKPVTESSNISVSMGLVNISNRSPSQLKGKPGRTGSRLPRIPIVMQKKDKISQI